MKRVWNLCLVMQRVTFLKMKDIFPDGKIRFALQTENKFFSLMDKMVIAASSTGRNRKQSTVHFTILKHAGKNFHFKFPFRSWKLLTLICPHKLHIFNLLEIFNSGRDIYCEIARIAFDEEITKKDKERRNQIKALVLGLIYGLSPFGFARDNEVSPEVAEDMFNRFFAAFPGASKWVKAQQSRNRGYTLTILGRKCHLHPYNKQWERNALNNVMQGSGADMTKLAMKLFRKNAQELINNNLVGIILPVHDEIVIWCDKSIAQQAEKLLVDAMVSIGNSMHIGVPSVVESHIADSWAEK